MHAEVKWATLTVPRKSIFIKILCVSALVSKLWTGHPIAKILKISSLTFGSDANNVIYSSTKNVRNGKNTQVQDVEWEPFFIFNISFTVL